MFRGGIERLERSGGKELMKFSTQGAPGKRLLVNDVRKIILDADSGLWALYQYRKPVISYCSLRESTVKHIRLDSTESENYLFDILKQGQYTLWAISNSALYKTDTRSLEVEKIQPEKGKYLGLYTFCLDDEGNIWIGTIGNGLFKYDIKSKNFFSINQELERKVYSIYSICYHEGVVWMGTDDGLYSYRPEDGQLMKFDKNENAQGQVYYPLSVLKSQDGCLYFGGTQGFTIVDPKKIKTNEYTPRALISSFYVNHSMVPMRYTVSRSGPSITLDYTELNFGFEFASDDYKMPEKIMYRYRLKGYSDEWITVDSHQRMVMYNKVPAGVYSFEVCASNNEGQWGEPTIIAVVRKSPPWASWPAFLVYFLILLGVLFFIYRHFTEKKRLKMLLYQENLEKEKKEQIHQAQLRFFTNISHDFRSPLSLILAAIDKLRKDGLKEYYYRILHGNAQRLLNLVNELMDFRTVENGKLKLELEPLDINVIVKGLASDFVDYADQYEINFSIECSAELCTNVYGDRNVIEKIVMNLLNNAFKYTHKKGNITIQTLDRKDFQSLYKVHYEVGNVKDPSFSIVVRDSGIGISAESISQVFERFYKVNTPDSSHHLGTGIGLALVRSLILLHKGMVAIYSEPNKGTDIIVSFPTDCAIFAKSDFKDSKEEKDSSVTTIEKISSNEKEDLKENINKLSIKGTRKILVVEDNDDLRTLISEALSEEYRVWEASDGIEALKIMEDVEFDLILSDIMMPRKDGVSLCQNIKNNVNTSHIPVILLTAKTSLESKIEGVDSGADLYFEKPIDFTYLKLSILNIFRNRQQLKEHYAKNFHADSSELATNEQDRKFLKRLVEYIESNFAKVEFDVNIVANEMGMSHSKLYTKVKKLTGKSIVEFVLTCRLRKAATLIIEEDISMKEVMLRVGIESQPYFTNAFKKAFGETPTSFAQKYKKQRKT